MQGLWALINQYLWNSVLPSSSRVKRPKNEWHSIIIYKFTSYTTAITHNIKCYKLVVHGYMFPPHCSHLQANFYRSSTFNVRTVWDPIVCTNCNVWEIKTTIEKNVCRKLKICITLIQIALNDTESLRRRPEHWTREHLNGSSWNLVAESFTKNCSALSIFFPFVQF